MNNPKNDPYYVQKMLTDIDFITAHMNHLTQDSLQADEVLLDSMLFRLIQINESAHNLTSEFKKANAAIPWTDISGLRNRIVHDYGNVDLNVVYVTLTEDIPALGDMMRKARFQ